MDVFLVSVAFLWILIASIQDLRKREVWNWLSFSLIAIVLAYRAFFAVINSNVMFFVYGVVGLLAFVILGYVFYYARVFAGGDAKLLFGLGAIFPLSGSWLANLALLLGFIVLLLFAGSIYGLVYSFFLVARNKKAFSLEFKKQFARYRKLEYLSVILAIALLLLPIILNDSVLAIFSVIFLLLPVLFIYGKAIENSCMIASVDSNQLTEGDWLYEPVKIGKKTIKPYWEGLSSKELEILKKYRGKIKIKQGIPFVPAFLIAFLAWVLLWNSSWGFWQILNLN